MTYYMQNMDNMNYNTNTNSFELVVTHHGLTNDDLDTMYQHIISYDDINENNESLENEVESDNESISDILPNDGNIYFSKKPKITLVEDEYNGSVLETCHICYEHQPKNKMVYFKEVNMVGNRCCMQNSMCGYCMLNNVSYNININITCPFCRNPVSEIETQDANFVENIKTLFASY